MEELKPYYLAIEFEAALTEPKYEKAITKHLNTDFAHLQAVIPFEAKITFHPRQASELDYIADLSTTYLRVVVQLQLKQLCNYHFAAQLFQGYFGLCSSIDCLYSPVVNVH